MQPTACPEPVEGAQAVGRERGFLNKPRRGAGGPGGLAQPCPHDGGCPTLRGFRSARTTDPSRCSFATSNRLSSMPKSS